MFPVGPNGCVPVTPEKRFLIHDIAMVSHELRIFVFDAIREALFNVVKHAKVSKVFLRVVRSAPDRITI